MIIRSVIPEEDAKVVAGIYNEYVSTSHATFELEPVSPSEMEERILELVGAHFPYLIAQDGVSIVGYAYGHPYRERPAYRRSIELSVYVDGAVKRSGIGTSLYRELITILGAAGFHTAIAGISLPNDASVRLHEKFGFEKVAHFREVGYKFDRWIDVGYWQLVL